MIETNATNLKLYVDPSARALDALRAVGLPATVLIDREGREVGRLVGPRRLGQPRGGGVDREDDRSKIVCAGLRYYADLILLGRIHIDLHPTMIEKLRGWIVGRATILCWQSFEQDA